MLQVYEYVRDHIEANDLPPTMAEIGRGCNVSSTTASKYVDILVAREHLGRMPEKRRAIFLRTDNPFRPRSDEKESHDHPNNTRNNGRSTPSNAKDGKQQRRKGRKDNK